MKKNKIIIPAMAMILFSTAASISGTVAWFTANRVFNTEIGNFQVVETDGNLDVEMGSGQGTVAALNKKSVNVLNLTNIAALPVYKADTAANRDTTAYPSPTEGNLFYDTTNNKMQLYTDHAWVENYKMDVGNIYKNASDSNHYYKATSETALAIIGDGTVLNPTVLTHGSLNFNDGHAWVLDPDASPEAPTFLDKGLDSGENWMYKKGITVKDGDGSGTDRTVNVYVAVSWEMKFTFTFAGDKKPVAVYLDMDKSIFTDNIENSPDFRRNSSDYQTKKGFRIGFHSAVYSAEYADAGDPAANSHPFVWGNNTPTGDTVTEWNNNHEIIDTNAKIAKDGKIYKAGESIAANATDKWDDQKGKFTEQKGEITLAKSLSSDASYVASAHAYSNTKTYEANEHVTYKGQIYKCTTAVEDPEEFNKLKWTLDPTFEPVAKHTVNNYVVHKNDDVRVADNAETSSSLGKNTRVCVLTSEHPSVTVKCAAWFEGTDPNIITGAHWDCMKANMTFYSRILSA